MIESLRGVARAVTLVAALLMVLGAPLAAAAAQQPAQGQAVAQERGRGEASLVLPDLGQVEGGG